MGSLTMAMSDTTFWFTSLLTTVVLLLPVVAWRFYKIDVHPTLTDKVTAQYHNLQQLPCSATCLVIVFLRIESAIYVQAKLVQRSARSRPKEGLPRPFSGRRSRRSVRSGYAFAHSEGFGRLITSGRIMREAGQGAVTLRGKNGAPAR